MKIILTRAEGPTKLLGTVTCTSFDQADDVLRSWARSAPKDGGYDKVDVELHFSPEAAMGFRFDMDYEHRSAVDIVRREALSEAKFYSGSYCPAHVSPAQYREICEWVTEERRAALVKLIPLLEAA